MVFFFSVPLWLAAIFIIVHAFTHPKRATISISRFLLGLIGFLMIIATPFFGNMATQGGPVFGAVTIGCMITLVACFVARNKLSRL